MIYDWFEGMRGEYSLERLCSAMKVSRSGYYTHRRRELAPRETKTTLLLLAMRMIAEAHSYRYGSPRMTAALHKHGLRCSENRVAKLMRKHHLGARRVRPFRITTRQDRAAIASPNLLQQRFRVERSNTVWLTDITYISTDEGWLFLTVVLDLASRRVVGLSMNKTLESDGVVYALSQALGRRAPSDGLILHSDRGSQYTSHVVRELVKTHRITQSMSGTGNCYDNAPMESFFATLKNELIHQRRYATREEARQSIFDYIELYYNAERLHSALGYQTPREWEQRQTNPNLGR